MRRRPFLFSLDGVSLVRGAKRILDGVTVSAPRGSCTVLIGPNGSGKSTLARLLSGHLFPSEGTVQVLGRTFGRDSVVELRRHVRLVQDSGVLRPPAALTALQVVLTGLTGDVGYYLRPAPAEASRARQVLARFGLDRSADQRWGLMSSGERLRVLLARAALQKPALIILDEPFAGLDLCARERLLASLDSLIAQPRRPGIVLITHHVEEIPSMTHQVVLLASGRVVAHGAPAEVLRPAPLKAAFGANIRIRRYHGRYAALLRASGHDWRP